MLGLGSLFSLCFVGAFLTAPTFVNGASAARLLCYVESGSGPRSFPECTHLIYTGSAKGEILESLLEDYKKNNGHLKIIVRITEVNKDIRKLLKSKLVNGLEVYDAHRSLNKTKVLDTVEEAKSAISSSGAEHLFVALPPHPELLAKYYDLRELTKQANFMTVQTHDLVSEKRVTYHPSRLSGVWDMMNTDSVVDLVIGLGVPASKIIISLPATARQFLLLNETLSTPGSPTEEDDPEVIDQKEVCHLLQKGHWTLERDQDLSAPYAFQNKLWISFEDTSSVDVKGKYARVRGLAGLALTDSDLDTETPCGPSLRVALQKVLNQQSRAPRAVILRSLSDEILAAPAQALGALQLSPYRITQVVDSDGVIHSIREDTRTEFTCTRQGYFVHPRSCARFYRCVQFDQLATDYTVFEFDCPEGLAFDSRYEVCVWPGSLPNTQACPGSSEIAPVPKNRYVCPEKEGYYVDPENCRWFFACIDHGETTLSAYEFRCPFGLGYDEDRLQCDWPWLVPACGKIGSYEAEAHGFSSAVLTGATGFRGQTADGVNIAAHQSLVSGASVDNLVGIQDNYLSSSDTIDSNYISSQKFANDYLNNVNYLSQGSVLKGERLLDGLFSGSNNAYFIDDGTSTNAGSIYNPNFSLDQNVFNVNKSQFTNIDSIADMVYLSSKDYSRKKTSKAADLLYLPNSYRNTKNTTNVRVYDFDSNRDYSTSNYVYYINKEVNNENSQQEKSNSNSQNGDTTLNQYTSGSLILDDFRSPENAESKSEQSTNVGNRQSSLQNQARKLARLRSKAYASEVFRQRYLQYLRALANRNIINSGSYIHDPTGDFAEPYIHQDSPDVPYVPDNSGFPPYKQTPDKFDRGQYNPDDYTFTENDNNNYSKLNNRGDLVGKTKLIDNQFVPRYVKKPKTTARNRVEITNISPFPSTTYRTVYIPQSPKSSINEIFGYKLPSVTVVNPTVTIEKHYYTPGIQIRNYNQLPLQSYGNDFPEVQINSRVDPFTYDYQQPVQVFIGNRQPTDSLPIFISTTISPAVTISKYEPSGFNFNKPILEKIEPIDLNDDNLSPTTENPLQNVKSYRTTSTTESNVNTEETTDNNDSGYKYPRPKAVFESPMQIVQTNYPETEEKVSMGTIPENNEKNISQERQVLEPFDARKNSSPILLDNYQNIPTGNYGNSVKISPTDRKGSDSDNRYNSGYEYKKPEIGFQFYNQKDEQNINKAISASTQENNDRYVEQKSFQPTYIIQNTTKKELYSGPIKENAIFNPQRQKEYDVISVPVKELFFSQQVTPLSETSTENNNLTNLGKVSSEYTIPEYVKRPPTSSRTPIKTVQNDEKYLLFKNNSDNVQDVNSRKSKQLDIFTSPDEKSILSTIDSQDYDQEVLDAFYRDYGYDDLDQDAKLDIISQGVQRYSTVPSVRTTYQPNFYGQEALKIIKAPNLGPDISFTTANNEKLSNDYDNPSYASPIIYSQERKYDRNNQYYQSSLYTQDNSFDRKMKLSYNQPETENMKAEIAYVGRKTAPRQDIYRLNPERLYEYQNEDYTLNTPSSDFRSNDYEENTGFIRNPLRTNKKPNYLIKPNRNILKSSDLGAAYQAEEYLPPLYFTRRPLLPMKNSQTESNYVSKPDFTTLSNIQMRISTEEVTTNTPDFLLPTSSTTPSRVSSSSSARPKGKSLRPNTEKYDDDMKSFQAPEYLPPLESYIRNNSETRNIENSLKKYTVSDKEDTVQTTTTSNINNIAQPSNLLGFGTVGPDAGLVYRRRYLKEQPVKLSDSYSLQSKTVKPNFASINEEFVPDTPQVRKDKVKKIAVVTKINDFNPFLVKKLGAVCSCQSPVLILKGRRPSPLGEKTVDDYQDNIYSTSDNIKEENIEDSSKTRVTSKLDYVDSSTFEPIIVPDEYEELGSTMNPITSKYISKNDSRNRENSASTTSILQTPALENTNSVQISVENSKSPDHYGPGDRRNKDETLQSSIDCQRAGLFRHPNKCNKFYACRWDCTKQRFTLHIFNCPVQLSFDTSIGACNWPSQGPACQGDRLLTNSL